MTARAHTAAEAREISVIVPTLDEEAAIAKTVDRMLAAGVGEVVVVDGGSTDDTCALAEAAGATVICSAPGRGIQQNAGARAASGNVLLFLHADTTLPTDFPERVFDALREPETAGGAFRFRLDEQGWKIRWLERMVALRCKLFGMPYGDQGIFARRETFELAGGFPDSPVMEDFELVQRLKKHGRIVMADGEAVTSARRWRRLGLLRATWSNNLCLAAYKLGVSPERIVRWRNA